MHREKNYNIREIIKHFSVNGEFLKGQFHTAGHINDTLIITVKNLEGEEKKYILQKINTNIFKNPMELMKNIENVTDHIREKLQAEGSDHVRGTLQIIKNREGRNFYMDEAENYWRVFAFIEGAKSYMKVEKPEHMYKTGKAIGKFHSQLSDFPMESLHETIKNFHHTAKRYETFLTAVKNNLSGKAEKIREEIDFILTREKETAVLVNLLAEGKLPLRVTHNDTKFNNIMLDIHSEDPIAVIDLDTVMPGLVHYDFGDSIRTGASTALEDETDLEKVNFDLKLFEAYTRGFLESAGSALTSLEIDYLAFSAKLITFEQAIRFLGDYLDGDLYYKIQYPNHNLDRARNQLKLVKDMENKMELMEKIVNKYR